MASMTWTTVAPTLKIATAMTVALRKPSRWAHGDNAKDAYRQVGKANLKPERDYRSAQPIDSATESEVKK